MSIVKAGAVLVIDQGTHSTRAIVFSAGGELLAEASVAVQCQVLPGGCVEQSVEDIVQSIQCALAELGKKLAQDVIESLTQAALVVQRSSLLACYSNGRAITSVINWQDTRNQAWVDEHREYGVKVRELTGLRMNAHYGASKMRWLLDNDVRVQNAYKNNDLLFVPLAAFLTQQITHSKNCVVDGVIASRTLLLEKNTLHWNSDMMNLLGIDASCLPKIVCSDYAFGKIEFAKRKIPLSLVGGDQSFVAFAAGFPLLPECAYINVGTGAFVQLAAEDAPDVRDLLYSPLLLTAEHSIYVLEGTVNAAASALDWLWQQQGEQLTFAQIEAALQQQDDLPVFVNTVAGIGSPFWQASSPPCFSGAGDTLQKAVAVLESVVFALMDNMALMQKSTTPIKKIMIGGGLSRLAGFCQRLADITGAPVIQLQTHELSAQGVAFYLLKKPYQAALQRQVFAPGENAALQQRYKKYRCKIAKKFAN